MTSAYMLDTDICSYIMRNWSPDVLTKEFRRVENLQLENWASANQLSR